MAKQLSSRFARLGRILQFYILKLPFVYVMIALGFVFEFLLTYPYMVLAAIDQRRRARPPQKRPAGGRMLPKTDEQCATGSSGPECTAAGDSDQWR